MFRLTLEKGDPQGATLDIASGEVVIGRSHSAGFRLAATDVSGQHVRIVVTGNKATAENLSRFGALLDGQPLTTPAPIVPGQRLQMGAKTVLLFSQAASAQIPPSDDRPTGEGPATGKRDGQATGAATGGSRAPAETSARPPPEKEAPTDEGLSRGSWTSASSADDHTRAMQTRVASPDEISFLKAADYQRARSRMMIAVAVILVIVTGLTLLLVHRPKPETRIEWPQDAEGQELTAYADSPVGGFRLAYPKTADAKATPQPNGFLVTCHLGRRSDVPFRLWLYHVVDERYGRETMDTSIEHWETQIAPQMGKWNFDKPLPIPLFFGRENGIPFKAISYQFEKDGSWSGVASVFRNGRSFVVVRAEVPTSERVRADDFLYTMFVEPSEEFLRGYWEGAPDLSTANAADILARAREELRRLAPATWEDLGNQIAGAIRKAAASQNTEQEKEALELLATLRQKQALWFNEQQCEREAAMAQGEADQQTRISRIVEVCKGVFPNPSDQRFYEVRKW